MSEDLGSALHDLAARAGREHADTRERTGTLRPEALVGAARRRRRTRAAVTSGVTALAVVAVGLGADAVGVRLDASPGPATTATVAPSPAASASPSATPVPSAADVVLPTGDPSLPFGVCGSVVGAALPTTATSTVTVETVLGAQSVPTGSPLVVTTRQWAPSTSLVALTDPRGPRLAVVRDGVVVAVTGPTVADRGGDAGAPVGWRSPTDTMAELDPVAWYQDGFVRATTGRVALTVCAPGEDGTHPATGVPLPPGTYEVHALLEVRTAGDGESDVVLPADPETYAPDEIPQLVASAPRTATGTPVELTVTAEGAPDPGTGVVTGPPTTYSGPLTCGAPAPTPTDPTGPLRLSVEPAVPSSAADGKLALDASLTWAGTGRLVGQVSVGVQAFGVRDGTIVATPGIPYVGSPADLLALPVDLGPGAPLDLSGRVRLVPCGFEGDRSTARPAVGAYEVYAATAVDVGGGLGGREEGSQDPGDGSSTVVVVSAPFSLEVAG